MERSGGAVAELTAAAQVQEAVEQLEVATSEEPLQSETHEVTVRTQVVAMGDGARLESAGGSFGRYVREGSSSLPAATALKAAGGLGSCRGYPEGRDRDEASSREDEHSAEGVPQNVKLLIRSLIERYALTKEQLNAIHTEYLGLRGYSRPAERSREGVRTTNGTGGAVIDEAISGVHLLRSGEPPTLLDARHVPASPMEEEEEEREAMELAGGALEKTQSATREGLEVGKMQNLVRSAIESFETSPVVGTADLGAKRKLFSLEEELNLKPSPFAQELLE